MIQLTKQSCEAEIKAYFREVLNLSKGNEEFPVNLDNVWPLVYARKDVAVKKLKNNELFIEGIDYRVFRQNVENSEVFHQGGRPTDIYMLSVPCLEFFIARKVRSVFEVYRKVFHKVAETAQLARQDVEPDIMQPIGLAETLQPLSDYMHQVDVRWENLKKATIGYKGRENVTRFHDEWVSEYRAMSFHLSQLVHYETINKIEGAYFI